MEDFNKIKPSEYWANRLSKKVKQLSKKNAVFNYSKHKGNIKAKVIDFYYLKWFYFLPFFIGYLASLFSLCKTYGRIRSISVFNKKIYRVFAFRLFCSVFFFFLGGPFYILFNLFLWPLYAIDASVYFDTWHSIVNDPSSINAIATLSTKIIEPFFNSSAWLYALACICLGNAINLPALIAKAIINSKTENYMNYLFLEDGLKIKLNRLQK